ncbi:uncharacterized protein [Aegilops tauschii subsp. strangulata]|uniref:uncharacterized protein isoform X1 n=1 Tax=Aegilops tauschii subsp. strangulata TaxID=200361 RepID=UPI001ABC91FE|nr:uncharacterized protein LOC109769711 isoform X2 [Aegilops tauschii subsp. strangulata]
MTAAAMASTLKRAYLSIYNWVQVLYYVLLDSLPGRFAASIASVQALFILCVICKIAHGVDGDDDRRTPVLVGNMALSCSRRRDAPRHRPCPATRGLLLCFQGNQAALPELDNSSPTTTTHRSQQGDRKPCCHFVCSQPRLVVRRVRHVVIFL